MEFDHVDELSITGDLTIDFWLCLRCWPDRWIDLIAKKHNERKSEYCVRIKNSETAEFYFGFYQAAVVLNWSPNDAIRLGEWTHVTCVIKCGEFARIYIDGMHLYEKRLPADISIEKTGASLTIASGRESDFAGKMRNIRIWQRALDDEQIILLMDNTGVSGTDLLAGCCFAHDGQFYEKDRHPGDASGSHAHDGFFSGEVSDDQISRKKEIASCFNKLIIDCPDEYFESLARIPDIYPAYERLGDAFFKQKKWGAAANIFSGMLSSDVRMPKFSVFQKMRAALNEIKNPETSRNAWINTCSSNAIAAQSCYNMISSGMHERALADFSVLVRKLFGESPAGDLWVDSFQSLSDLFQSSRPEIPNSSVCNSPVPQKKIIVSGMGWSGSGALYDFFREFRGVRSVKGEFTHIEGESGLFDLSKSLSDVPGFKKKLLKHFGLVLLGLATYGTSAGYKTSRSARSYSLSKARNHSYAAGVNIFIKSIASIIPEGPQDRIDAQSFAQIASTFLDNTCIGKYSQNDDFVLLDNVVHIKNVKAMSFIDNALLFATFRDPRSNFVAMKKELGCFLTSACDYATNYRKVRKKFESDLSTMGRNRDNVVVVQFENFVLSEAYRRQVMESAALETADQDQFRYFQPSVSEKNVFIHESYENQDEIRIIENEIPEYCVDVHQIKLASEQASALPVIPQSEKRDQPGGQRNNPTTGTGNGLLRSFIKPFKGPDKKQETISRQAEVLNESGWFDQQWYLSEYPDVASAAIDPVEHYLRFGADEGRNPSPTFDTLYYLQTNPDVAAARVNPLFHYIEFGISEGRRPCG
ncbi:MAG: LamG-like jellyroll fold domain-containing protein [Candidatus Accumulibacter sp. UW20]|jgi:hypothetical protein